MSNDIEKIEVEQWTTPNPIKVEALKHAIEFSNTIGNTNENKCIDIAYIFESYLYSLPTISDI